MLLICGHSCRHMDLNNTSRLLRALFFSLQHICPPAGVAHPLQDCAASFSSQTYCTWENLSPSPMNTCCQWRGVGKELAVRLLSQLLQA